MPVNESPTLIYDTSCMSNALIILDRVSRAKRAKTAGAEGSIIDVNVGGTRFRSTTATLSKAPYFEALLKLAGNMDAT